MDLAIIGLTALAALAPPSPGALAPTEAEPRLHRAAFGSSALSPGWVEREVRAMGTRLRIRVMASGRPAGIHATEAAFEAVREAESLLSTWRPDTELARLNRAPVGASIPISRELLTLLNEVRSWARRTDGAFEPVVGSLVDAWGLRDRGSSPSGEALARAVAATGPDALALSTEGRLATRTDSLAWIDAGAFGKGYALRRAVRALERAGATRAILDFGGQIATLGPSPPTGDVSTAGWWPLTVAHPDRRGRPALELTVPGGLSVSTTGGSERFVVADGQTHSHVIDPRSGRPVPPWGSVTVVAEDPMVADLTSTALFVLGPDEALKWAEGRDDLAVLVLTTPFEADSGESDGPDRAAFVRARWTPTMEAYLARGSEKDGDGRPGSCEPVRRPGPDGDPGATSRTIDTNNAERWIRGTP